MHAATAVAPACIAHRFFAPSSARLPWVHKAHRALKFAPPSSLRRRAPGGRTPRAPCGPGTASASTSAPSPSGQAWRRSFHWVSTPNAAPSYRAFISVCTVCHPPVLHACVRLHATTQGTRSPSLRLGAPRAPGVPGGGRQPGVALPPPRRGTGRPARRPPRGPRRPRGRRRPRPPPGARPPRVSTHISALPLA